MRRQRSASREKAQTMRQGTRLNRPVSVPYGNSDNVELLSGGGGKNRLSLDTTPGSSSTPRRSHSDCYTRSSPKPFRKYKSPTKKN